MHSSKPRNCGILWSVALAALILAPVTHAQDRPTRRAEPVKPARAEGGGPVTEDDLARFLGGLSGRSGSPLKGLESTPAWQQHQKAFDDLWLRVQQGRHVEMRRWALSEIRSRVGTPNTLYYLFGGPDFVTVQVFFPGTPVFILAGLEPLGSIGNPAALGQGDLDGSLRSLRGSMDGVLRLGFFETKDMRSDLNRGAFTGVKPILYASMARSGDTVIDSSYFTLNGSGMPEYSNGIPKGSVTGLKITYRPTSGGAVRTTYYLNGNVANGGDKRLYRFLERQGPADSYLKAASYLMHTGDFSTVRNFLLNNSTFILQDDSGIPLQYFDQNKWELVFFGNYRGVMPAFAKYYQPNLASIYERGAGREMRFGLGYRTSDRQASQMLAIRGGSTRGVSQPDEPPTARAIPVR